jgi:hypothetical protein
MKAHRHRGAKAALLSLETAADAARSGFACLFSTSDEYETALISERRAQGRYGRSRSPWPAIMFAGSVLLVVGTALLLR